MAARSVHPSITTKAGAACAALAALLCAAPAALANLGITATGNLNFGRFAASSGGTITMAPNGLRTRSGGVVLLFAPSSPASYTVTENNKTRIKDIVILTLPPNGSVLLRSGAHSMALTAFTSSRPASGMLSATTQIFTVGATLQVGASQAAGNYSGNFPVTLEYQ